MAVPVNLGSKRRTIGHDIVLANSYRHLLVRVTKQVGSHSAAYLQNYVAYQTPVCAGRDIASGLVAVNRQRVLSGLHLEATRNNGIGARHRQPHLHARIQIVRYVDVVIGGHQTTVRSV
jgi:hypothetical protein